MHEPTRAPCWCDYKRLTRRLADTIAVFLDEEYMRAVESKWLDDVAADVVGESGLAECPACKEEL